MTGCRFNSGSGTRQPLFPGTRPEPMLMIETAAPKAPAAARAWPVAPFVEDSRGIFSPNRARIARASARSLSIVPVP